MKHLLFVFALIAAQCAVAQLLPHYDNPNGTPTRAGFAIGSQTTDFSYENQSFVPSQPAIHAENRAGISAKEFYGDGYGTIVTMQARPAALTSFGFATGGFYMLQAGAFVVPLFAQLRQNFWMTRDEGIFGAAYGYAAAGPTVGIGQSMFAPSFGAFLQSLSLRVGGGAMAGIGAEVGGSAFGWSLFTEVGAMGLAFTAPLGPQRSYAAPFVAFGMRRAIGN